MIDPAAAAMTRHAPINRRRADVSVIWEPELPASAVKYKALAEQLTRDHFEPLVEEIDRVQRYPTENIEKLHEAGLTRMFLPAKFGGADATLTDATAVVEAVAKGCPSTAAIITTYQLGAYIIQRSGTPEQQEKVLVNAISKGLCVSFCLSEINAGSDPAGMETTAVEEGDGYRIKGEKFWVGGGAASVYFVVFAKTDPTAGSRGITGFLVEKGAEGVVVDFIADKMGQRGSYTTNLKVDTWVPKSAVVGEFNKGLKLALMGLNLGRITISGHALGMGVAAFEEAARRACERVTFGKPIIDHQSIGFRLSDMAARLSSARMMVYYAAKAFDDGKSTEEISNLAAMSKMLATEATHFACNEAVQIWGSMGYIKPTKVERLYRDQRINQVYEGSSEIQRLVLARSIKKEFTAA